MGFNLAFKGLIRNVDGNCGVFLVIPYCYKVSECSAVNITVVSATSFIHRGSFSGKNTLRTHKMFVENFIVVII
jgi:hypothetical protein